METQKVTHYGYGSGMPGSMFDNGPAYAGTDKIAAADAALCIFSDDLTADEYNAAHNDLVNDGIHYFPSERRCELGASIVQIFEVDPSDYPEETADAE